jgi:hypothetical protein
LPDQPITDPHVDDEATRAGAHLPGLDIEIVHHRTAEAERISVHVQAMPSFESLSRALEAGNPFAFWAAAARMAWLPWLTCFGAFSGACSGPWLSAAQALALPRHITDAPPTLPEG